MMVLFKKKTKPGEHELLKEGAEEVLHINYDSYPRIPSIEDDPLVMAAVIDKLTQNPSASRVIFHQKKKYEYGHSQTQMLVEVANIYSHFLKQRKILSQAALEVFGSVEDSAERIKNLQYIVLSLLKADPIGAFVETKRLLREEKINFEKVADEDYKIRLQPFLTILSELYSLLLNTKVVANAKDFIDGYSIGSREVYKSMFRPVISPDFMYTRLVATPPLTAAQVDSYSTGKNINVQVFNTKETIKPLYHVIPPEFQISEDKYGLLELARKVLAEHQPKAEEFLDTERMRETFFNIGKDLLTELADHRNLALSYQEIEELTDILVRYTVGFGLIETLLQDDNIQDIAINSPAGVTPLFVVHGKYDECITNIVPSIEDVEGWASKFRLISARPLDEANPVLDTELSIPGARARVSIITRPLNPTGLAFSLRRHRDKPWTLPLFVNNGMINDLAAGLISFLVDGNRTLLVAGTRSSGKTSVLGSVMVEIMRKYRLITLEDSVTGDSEILIRDDGKIKRTTIGNLVDSSIDKYSSWYSLSDHEITGNYQETEILAMDKKGQIKWTKISKLIRHKVNKPIYKIITRTGKTIKVTGDHSLFGLKDKAEIVELKVKEINIGDHIATSRKIPENLYGVKEINLLDYLERFDKGYLFGDCVKEFLKNNKHEIKQLGKEYKHNRSLIGLWLRNGMIPIKIVKDMKCLGYDLRDLKEAEFKYANSYSMPVRIEINEELLTFFGLWLADGCYDSHSVILSVVEEENRNIARRVAEKYGFKIKMHSDKFSLMLNSKVFKDIMIKIFELRGNAYTKRIPELVFNLSRKQISYVLKGIYSGDGHVSNKEIVMSLCSRKLLEDIQNLLLNFGISLRIRKMRKKDKTFGSSISSNKFYKIFENEIGLLPQTKRDNLKKLSQKFSTHDTTDIIPLMLNDKKKIKEFYFKFNENDYVNRNNNLGREKLSGILSQVQIRNTLIDNLKLLSDSHIFWDEVKSIEIIEEFNDYVYDLSVPECESFICNGIIAHNTLELPTEALRKFGYNIQPMKVRSALLKSGSELSADEGIRTSLRMGDSSLIVGEVRSSIRGNEKVVIIDSGETKRIEIKDLEGKEISNIYIPSMDFDLKFKLKKLTGFVKHPQRKKLLEVTTKTGRKITVTPDHSLFTHKDFRIVPIECKDLKQGSKVIIPEKLPSNYNDIKSINILEMLEDEDCRLEGYEEDLRQIIKKIGYKKASEISSCTQDIYQYLRKGIQHSNITISDFRNLSQEANQSLNTKILQIRRGTSGRLPAEIEINKDFCRFLGYYVSEGWTDTNGDVVFSNGDDVIIKDMINLSETLFGIIPYVRQTESLGISTQISLNNKILGLMIKKLGCGSVALEKRVPSIIFGLSEDKICEFLKGYFDGDGSQTSKLYSGNRIACSTISKNLADDLLYLFLNLGIVARMYEKEARGIGKHRQHIVEFKERRFVELFINKIGFKKYKKELINRAFSHTKFNTVNYEPEVLEKHVKLKRKFRHLRRYNSCGKEYLKKVVEECENSSEIIKAFVTGEFFLDEVKSIKEINLEEGEYVYDLSVEPSQNFIGGFGGLMLHNTEALALFEAMRTGALANTVAGTIHGDSPYGVFDRVVNDLQVPRTSFKATDIIIVANPIRSADGLHKFRRVTQITEVRKHWEKDPLAEGGFVDLMRYDPQLDTLVPTDELINGDSEIVKSIGGQIREWAGSWDAVWENILLRSKIKRLLIDYSKNYNIPDLLEAKAVIQMNDEFHRVSDTVKEKTGYLDNKRILFEWEEELKRYIKLNYGI